MKGGGGATRPLPRMRVQKNSAKTQQSGLAPRSGTEMKNERYIKNCTDLSVCEDVGVPAVGIVGIEVDIIRVIRENCV